MVIWRCSRIGPRGICAGAFVSLAPLGSTYVLIRSTIIEGRIAPDQPTAAAKTRRIYNGARKLGMSVLRGWWKPAQAPCSPRPARGPGAWASPALRAWPAVPIPAGPAPAPGCCFFVSGLFVAGRAVSALSRAILAAPKTSDKYARHVHRRIRTFRSALASRQHSAPAGLPWTYLFLLANILTENRSTSQSLSPMAHGP